MSNSFEVAKEEPAKQSASDQEIYDGIVGILPDWVPPIFQLVYSDIQRRLKRSKVEHAKSLTYLNTYHERLEDGFKGVTHIPPSLIDQISLLHWIREAVSAGEENGLAILVGNLPAKSIIAHKKQSENLTIGRIKGAAANKDKANNNKSYILKMNDDLLKNPLTFRKSLDERAEIITKSLAKNYKTMSNGKQYKVSTIKRYITGM